MNTLLSALSNLNVNSFYFINHGLDNKTFDILMPLITDFGSILAWVLILGLMYVLGSERTRKIAFLAFLALILA
ncbi:MAG: phosphatase PAP2 family protein, partial [Methanobacterium sp.]|nr:phosphatase PAP2 family protein [Methanobacterium sp.]